MAIVSTLPDEGEQPTFYDIPDAELQKFRPVEMQKVAASDAPRGGRQVEAPGALKVDDDVQAYGDTCICYIYDKVTNEVLYWYYCKC